MKRSFLSSLTAFSLDRPKTVIGIAVILTVLFGIQFPRITIDTDPENMLEADQSDRVLYNRVKKDFGIHDLIVVGIVDEKGVFRPESLERVTRATSEILPSRITGAGNKGNIGDPQDQRSDHRRCGEPHHHGQRQVVRRAAGYPSGDA
jgi:hypothetical protein